MNHLELLNAMAGVAVTPHRLIMWVTSNWRFDSLGIANDRCGV